MQLANNKPILAILTESIRYDNQDALKYFELIKPVHFYETAPYGDLKPEELADAIQYKDLADLEARLLALRPDIIQGAEPYASKKALKLCLLAKKVAAKLNVPLIFPTLENRPVEKRFGKFAGFFLKKIFKSYVDQAKLIFYLNEGAKKNLLEVGADPGKLKKMLYGIWGVETDVFTPMPKIRKENKILVTGRLDEAKGLPYVVDAWRVIENRFPTVSIQFVGKGELDYLVKGDRMSHGFVKNSDLPQLINSALFTITASVTLPKWEEQVGMTNLQALACGVPVITTLSGAIPEYINETVGILVPERDSASLASAMAKLLEDEKLRYNLGINGRNLVLERYDAKKTVRLIEEILLNLIEYN